jgi:hypothetical protein
MLGIDPQPFRAGLKFSYRPSGPRIDLMCYFFPDLTEPGRAVVAGPIQTELVRT